METLARIITGNMIMEFNELIKHIIKNLKSYRGLYCEGIPKLRIIKLLLIEIAELKKVKTQFNIIGR